VLDPPGEENVITEDPAQRQRNDRLEVRFVELPLLPGQTGVEDGRGHEDSKGGDEERIELAGGDLGDREVGRPENRHDADRDVRPGHGLIPAFLTPGRARGASRTRRPWEGGTAGSP